MKKLIPVVLSLSMLPLQAQAFEVGVLGGITSSRTSAEIGPSTRNTTADYAFGAMADLPLISPLPGFIVEVDALVMRRKVEINNVQVLDASGSLGNSVLSSASTTYFMVPAIARFTALPIVNAGVGPYFATPLGKISTNTNGQTQESDSSTDLGLVASVQARIPLMPLIHAVVDGRYILGLKDQGESTGSNKFRDFQALAGVSIGF